MTDYDRYKDYPDIQEVLSKYWDREPPTYLEKCALMCQLAELLKRHGLVISANERRSQTMKEYHRKKKEAR